MEVAEPAVEGELDVAAAVLPQPGDRLGRGAHRPEDAGPRADAAQQLVARAGVGEQRAPRQRGAGGEHAHHLGDGTARVGEAVDAGQGDDEVERRIGERKGAHVGRDGGDLVGDAEPGRGRARPAEHRRRDVGGDVVDPLTGTQAAEGDARPGRHVEDPGTAREGADLVGRLAQEGQVAAGAGPPGRAADAVVLHEPRVDVGPQRVLVPATQPGEPHVSRPIRWASRGARGCAASAPARRTRRRGRPRAA